MTEQTQPTDAELRAWVQSLIADDDSVRTNDERDHMSFARAVLAKWGQPQAVASGEPVDFVVSAVVIKETPKGFNTQNKLYPVNAVSAAEANGKVLPLLKDEFPEHHLHTMCHIAVAAPPPQAVREPCGSLSGSRNSTAWLLNRKHLQCSSARRLPGRAASLEARLIRCACSKWLRPSTRPSAPTASPKEASMALSDEQIEKLTGASRTRASMWLVASAIARAIEAEVRKDDEALIRQLRDALESQCGPKDPDEIAAIAAARARLKS